MDHVGRGVISTRHCEDGYVSIKYDRSVVLRSPLLACLFEGEMAFPGVPPHMVSGVWLFRHSAALSHIGSLAPPVHPIVEYHVNSHELSRARAGGLAKWKKSKAEAA